MDQKLHARSPLPGSTGNLLTAPDAGERSAAFLFEPAAPVPFSLAWEWQRCWQQRLLAAEGSDREAVWILQHPSCFTLGRGATEDHLRFEPENPPAPLYRIDRGGEVTHHAPGQLVAYPVLDLRRREPDLHWYLRELEQVVIDVLAALDLKGQRIPGLTGVWLEGRKVAAVGVGCRRWITQHGLALNVSCAMEGFAQVVPCGISDRPVDRLQRWIPGLTPELVQPLLRDALAQRLSLSWCDLAGLDSGWYS